MKTSSKIRYYSGKPLFEGFEQIPRQTSGHITCYVIAMINYKKTPPKLCSAVSKIFNLGKISIDSCVRIMAYSYYPFFLWSFKSIFFAAAASCSNPATKALFFLNVKVSISGLRSISPSIVCRSCSSKRLTATQKSVFLRPSL